MINLHQLDHFRIVPNGLNPAIPSMAGDSTCGVFVFRSDTTGEWLRVIAVSGMGWDHVSVSLEHRTPTWAEMEQVKRLFFNPDESCMQLHVPVAEHIDCHPYCLHIWRPLGRDIPRPPSWMV
jgi:hypothetical protein